MASNRNRVSSELVTTAVTAGVNTRIGTSGTAFTFAGFSRGNGGGGYIVGARIFTDTVGIVPVLRARIYNAIPAALTGIANGFPMSHTLADESKYIGTITFPAMVPDPGGISSQAENMNVRLPFQCADDSSTLYAVLETDTEFVTVNTKTFKLTLIQELD